MPRNKHPKLTVIEGGHPPLGCVAGVPIWVSQQRTPSFPIDVWVMEEDTNLLLSADTKMREPIESIAHLNLRALNAKPIPPGSVLVRKSTPCKFLAVVLDINAEPMYRREWICNAYQQVFRMAASMRLARVATALLGTIHGGCAVDTAVDCFHEALQHSSVNANQRIWLTTRPEHVKRVRELVSKLTDELVRIG